MPYDLEKYRNKREKVLGKKKRSIKFGTVLAILSVIIVLGFGLTVIPKSVAYFTTRHLDDVILKVEDKPFPHEVFRGIMALEGVEDIVIEKNRARVIITLDRTELDHQKLSTYLEEKGVKTILLKKMSHQQRMKVMKKEKEFETP
ncbi:hypothetical protein ACFL2O_08440 [Thermodesulfobacteriota bacterium]